MLAHGGQGDKGATDGAPVSEQLRSERAKLLAQESDASVPSFFEVERLQAGAAKQALRQRPLRVVLEEVQLLSLTS